MKYSMFVLQARIIRTGTRNDTLYTYEINQIDLVSTYRMKHSTFGSPARIFGATEVLFRLSHSFRGRGACWCAPPPPLKYGWGGATRTCVSYEARIPEYVRCANEPVQIIRATNKACLFSWLGFSCESYRLINLLLSWVINSVNSGNCFF